MGQSRFKFGPLTRKWILAVVVPAYLVTWVGGWLARNREMADLAQQLYADAEARYAEYLEAELRNPRDRADPIRLRAGGTKSAVDWCVPILPAVLVSDSYYVVGPLYGKGTVKIVFYYGTGSVTLFELWGWIA
jgi:hypothetical protein